jgi:GDP-L-fucose synthase
MTTVVAGAYGLAGSALTRQLEKLNRLVIPLGRKDLDFTDRKKTFSTIRELAPSTLFISAAKVGGIKANDSSPVDFLSVNIQIQTNLLDAAHYARVNRVIFLASSCIYPKFGKQPLVEDDLMSGKLEPTNSAYAIAKIAGIELVKSYRKQYGYDWISLIPSNLYGPGDNFSFEQGHALSALIAKFWKAKRLEEKEVELWGDGSPKREFLYVDDFASAAVLCGDSYSSNTPINIGTGEDISIKDLAGIVASIIGYEGKISWSNDELNGTPRKLLNISKISSLGWNPSTSLKEGISKTVDWYSKMAQNDY